MKESMLNVENMIQRMKCYQIFDHVIPRMCQALSIKSPKLVAFQATSKTLYSKTHSPQAPIVNDQVSYLK